MMNFSKIVFAAAGIWGLLTVTPLYFLLGFLGQQSPPPITHPEFYYGFVGVAVAWQLAFLVIALDPLRYRILIVPALIEKISFVACNLMLWASHRIPAAQALPASTDLLWALLFTVSWVKTSAAIGTSTVSVPEASS
jgi:hypothetical protein